MSNFSTPQCNLYAFNDDYLEEKLWNQAENTISKHLTANDRIGAKFECYIWLLLDHIAFNILGYSRDHVRISHNKFSPKAYRNTHKQGADITISQKTPHGYIPKLAIECKHYITANPYISPKQYQTHIAHRFRHITNTPQLLISKGIHKLTNITHITNNYHTQLTTQLLNTNTNKPNKQTTTQHLKQNLYKPHTSVLDTTTFSQQTERNPHDSKVLHYANNG